MTDSIHPIGPRDRDIEPVERLHRLAREGKRDRSDAEEGEAHEHAPERRADPVIEQPPPPDIDDGNPHIDVRV